MATVMTDPLWVISHIIVNSTIGSPRTMLQAVRATDGCIPCRLTVIMRCRQLCGRIFTCWGSCIPCYHTAMLRCRRVDGRISSWHCIPCCLTAQYCISSWLSKALRSVIIFSRRLFKYRQLCPVLSHGKLRLYRFLFGAKRPLK